MLSKKNLLTNWKLYVITDSLFTTSQHLADRVSEAINGGASVIQLRDKRATDDQLISLSKSILTISKPKNVPLIINDRIRVARLSGANGVHLGQEDGDLKEAREALGESAIIGRSTHSRDQALKAQAEGFDYIGVGPIFQTPTKPNYEVVGLELVQFAAKNIRIPFVAIGGINESNAAMVRQAGAKTIAVVRAVMANEDPRLAAKLLIERMN